jgi:hypothetical protein
MYREICHRGQSYYDGEDTSGGVQLFGPPIESPPNPDPAHLSKVASYELVGIIAWAGCLNVGGKPAVAGLDEVAHCGPYTIL